MTIAFELYSTGLINQVMSLEIAVGISAFYKKPIVLHNLTNTGIYSPIGWTDNGRGNVVSNHPNNVPKNLTSLIDWNRRGWIIKTENLNKQLSNVNYKTISSCGFFIDCNKDLHDTMQYKKFEEFIFNPNKNYNFITNILFYSRFFKNRSVDIDIALSAIKWKQPYYELAKDIALELGEFSGVHLRMTDHRRVTFIVGEEDFNIGLKHLENKELPIILSTDDKDFSWVQSNKNRYQLLDDIIIHDWGDRFKQLPYHDEVVFGLICNLVLGYSKYFVGTPGSTYTGYIQRHCNMRNDNFEWNFFSGSYGTDAMACKDIYDIEKPRWWHEHPNSKLRI